eukprot:scaffold24708_cov67-Phaeocystis_antarctica.AAC.7
MVAVVAAAAATATDAAAAAATAAGEARPEAAVKGAAAVAAAVAAAAAAAVRAGGTASNRTSVYSRCRWRWRSLSPRVERRHTEPTWPQARRLAKVVAAVVAARRKRELVAQKRAGRSSRPPGAWSGSVGPGLVAAVASGEMRGWTVAALDSGRNVAGLARGVPPVVGGCGRGGDRLPAGFWRLVGSRLQQQWPSTHMVVGCGMRDGDPLLALRSDEAHYSRRVTFLRGVL